MTFNEAETLLKTLFGKYDWVEDERYAVSTMLPSPNKDKPDTHFIAIGHKIVMSPQFRHNLCKGIEMEVSGICLPEMEMEFDPPELRYELDGLSIRATALTTWRIKPFV